MQATPIPLVMNYVEFMTSAIYIRISTDNQAEIASNSYEAYDEKWGAAGDSNPRPAD